MFRLIPVLLLLGGCYGASPAGGVGGPPGDSVGGMGGDAARGGNGGMGGDSASGGASGMGGVGGASGGGGVGGGETLELTEIECLRLSPTGRYGPLAYIDEAVDFCLGPAPPLDSQCFEAYAVYTTKIRVSVWPVAPSSVRRVQLCDVRSEAQLCDPAFESCDIVPNVELACVGSSETPETWTPESCEPYFPELYAAPDAEGCVELELEDPLFTYEVPCSLANIAGASGATYWNERFGTVRLWHAPESAL